MISLDWNLLFTVINLLILLVLMKLFLFKPINKIIEKRQQEVDQQLNDADTQKAEAAALKEQYESSMQALEAEKDKNRADAQKAATEEYDRIVADAHGQADEILAEAKAEAETEKAKILRQAESDITDMLIAATSKVAAAHCSEESDRRLYDEFLTKAGDSLDKEDV